MMLLETKYFWQQQPGLQKGRLQPKGGGGKLILAMKKTSRGKKRRKFIEEQTHLTITYDWIIGLVWHLTAAASHVRVCLCESVCLCVGEYLCEHLCGYLCGPLCVCDKTYVCAPICRLCKPSASVGKS